MASAYRGGVSRADSDEAYVIDLCEQVLGAEALRQHRFSWLLGDPGTNGARRRLPVDVYWPTLGLVVEYRERQHDGPVPFFDKPDRLTVSGVHRGQQRAIYDARRDDLIPAAGLCLVIIKPGDLDSTSRGRLRRNTTRDVQAIQRLLKVQPD